MTPDTPATGSAAPGAPVARPGGPLAQAVGSVPPPVLLLVSIVSIQLGAAVAVNLFQTLGPVATTFLRLGIAALLLLAVHARGMDRSAVRRHAPLLLLFGCAIGAMNLCFYGAIARIPLGIAVAIEFVGPLGVAAATSRKPLHFVWIALAAGGLALLTPEIGNGLDPLGVVLALGAGAGWAAFILISPRVGRRVGDRGLAVGMAVAAVFTLPFALAAGGLDRLQPAVLLGAFGVALLSTALPLSLEFEALRRMSARAYGIIVTLEPVAAAIVGALILSQALAANAVIAIVCVTAAAIGVTLTDRRGAAPDPA